jgi:hypothetical protein
MLLPDEPSVFAYVVLGVLVVFQLPWLGRAVLRFLRELDDYRATRRRP